MLNPDTKKAYATVTNRCRVSIIDYSSFTTCDGGESATCEIVELARIQTGSNPSGISK